MQIHSKHSSILLIRGLPGSGKSFLATKLKEAIRKDVILLDPDITNYTSPEYLEHVKDQEAQGVDPKLHAYRFLRAQAYKGIEEGKIVIWNQPFTNLEIFHKMTANLRKQAREHDVELSILVIEVEISPEIAKQRVNRRKQRGGHGPSDATFERFKNDYQTFSSEGYRTVQVNGEDNVDISITKILESV